MLADATFAAVRELLFFLPFGALAVAAWAYDGWVFAQSGARWPEMKVVGSGYFPSRNALASHESGNFSAYARGLPEKEWVSRSSRGMSGSKDEGVDLFGGGHGF